MEKDDVTGERGRGLEEKREKSETRRAVLRPIGDDRVALPTRDSRTRSEGEFSACNYGDFPLRECTHETSVAVHHITVPRKHVRFVRTTDHRAVIHRGW